MYGQFFVNDIDSDNSYYQGVVLVNTTAQSVTGAWGAYANEIFLRQYLSDQGMLGDSMTLTFVDQPFPLSLQYQSIIKASAGTTSAILMVIAYMMISDSLIQNIIKER